MQIHSFERVQISDQNTSLPTSLHFRCVGHQLHETSMCFLFYSEWMRRHTFALQICNPCTFSDSDQHVPPVFRHRTADGRSRPRLLPPSRRCVLGVFGWEALNIDGTTSYYWQSGSKWESTVFCCGGCDPSTCLPLYLTCRTEFVSARIRSFAGRA